MTPCLAPATADDLAFCEHLNRTNMVGYLAARGIAWDPERFRASWAEFENLLIVAGGAPIGLLRLLPEGGALGLRDLQVAPAHQRRGVGGWAVRQAQAITLQRGHPRLRLRVYAENPARMLYARMGFVVEAEADGKVHMAWDPHAPRAGSPAAHPTATREKRAMRDLEPVFVTLSAVLRRHARGFSARTDEPGHLYLELPAAAPKGKPRFFGAVQTKKSYVSYHLMPVYEDPGLLDGISAGLRGRMQGKSCFNFTGHDQALFAELDALTARCAVAAGRAVDDGGRA